MIDPASRLLEIQSVLRAIKSATRMLLLEIEDLPVASEARRDRVILFTQLAREFDKLRQEERGARRELVKEASGVDQKSPIALLTQVDIIRFLEQDADPVPSPSPTDSEVRRRHLLERIMGKQRVAALEALLVPRYRS